MRRIALLAAGVTSLVGCEVLLGIHDKTEQGDPSVPCAQQPSFVFCDDFDSETEAGKSWLWDTPTGGSSIELDSVDFKTPPRSVQIVVPPQGQGAQLGKPLGGLTSGLRLAFDLRVDAGDVSGIGQVGIAQLIAAQSNLTINYVIGPGNTAEVQVYETQTNAQVLTKGVTPPPLQTWTRVVIAYDPTQGLTVLEDGMTLLTAADIARGPAGDTTLIVGAVFANQPASQPLTFELDDVVLRGP